MIPRHVPLFFVRLSCIRKTGTKNQWDRRVLLFQRDDRRHDSNDNCYYYLVLRQLLPRLLLLFLLLLHLYWPETNQTVLLKLWLLLLTVPISPLG